MLIPVCYGKVTVLLDDEETENYPSFEYFQYKAPEYKPVTGLSIPISVAKDPDTGKCNLSLPKKTQSNIDQAVSDGSSYPSTILIISFGTLYNKCGYRCYTEAWAPLLELKASMLDMGFPPIDAILMFCSKTYDGTPGNPMKEYYICGAGIPDAPPPNDLNIVFIDRVSNKDLSASIKSLAKKGTVTLTVEQGN